MRPDLPAGLQTVHPRHHHIEQDHVGPAGFNELHRLATTAGEHQLVPLPLEPEAIDFKPSGSSSTIKSTGRATED